MLSSSVSLDNETEKEFSLSSPGGSQQTKGNIEREIEIDFKDQDFEELTFDWGVEFPWKDGEVHGDLKINHLAEIKKAAADFRGDNQEMKISLAEEKMGLTYYPPKAGKGVETELGFTINTKEELNSFLILELDFDGFEMESVVAITSTKNDTGVELQHVIEW